MDQTPEQRKQERRAHQIRETRANLLEPNPEIATAPEAVDAEAASEAEAEVEEEVETVADSAVITDAKPA